ncbi:hypothetical protein N752_04710 [Desulforamulus aquiferis]|nr:CAP domain-containing protein [Desulforamulus aquiferis]RYD06193.1 hypothetical protein N752_04710 [Desulforamulus aquiferis]
MAELINQARTKAGLPALVYDAELSAQAAKNLKYYQSTGQIPGQSMLYQTAVNGGYSSLGQTMVSGADVKTLVDKQLAKYASQSLLNSKYNSIGLVITETKNGLLCVQLLAAKKNVQVQPRPSQHQHQSLHQHQHQHLRQSRRLSQPLLSLL